jgi:hypothetical protein
MVDLIKHINSQCSNGVFASMVGILSDLSVRISLKWVTLDPLTPLA